ncbi:hypothetical protein ACVXZ4_09910 [Lacisediminihabitans sp. FW035]
MAIATMAVVGAVLGISGCGVLDPSQAVTYEVGVVSGTSDGALLQVEYSSRETGLSERQTIEETVDLSTAPLQFETIGRAADDVSISVVGVPGIILQCTVLLDGVAVTEQQSSAAGDGVVCAATTPTAQD